MFGIKDYPKIGPKCHRPHTSLTMIYDNAHQIIRPITSNGWNRRWYACVWSEQLEGDGAWEGVSMLRGSYDERP